MVEKKEKRYFSREFKRDAVELVVKKGKSATKVARDLDIHPNLIHLWRRRYFDVGRDATGVNLYKRMYMPMMKL